MGNNKLAIFLTLFFPLMLLSADKNTTQHDDVSQVIYDFPALMDMHVYPIFIYPQKNKHMPTSEIHRPLGIPKKVYDELESKIKELEECTLNLNEQNVEHKKMMRQERKVAGEGLYGKFCIFTAINKDRKFENPWYCMFRMNLDVVTRQECRKAMIGKPHGAWDKKQLMPFGQKETCNNTLRRMVQFLSHEGASLDIGPYPVYTYLLNKRGKKWKPYRRQGEVIREPQTKFDLQHIYDLWPEHGTRNTVCLLVAQQNAQNRVVIPTIAEHTDSAYTSSSSSTSTSTPTKNFKLN